MKAILTLFFFAIGGMFSYTQCTLEALGSLEEIYCGQQVSLSAYGTSSAPLLDNDFNTPANQPGQGWASTTAAMFSNPCSPGPDGTPHLWMGDFSSQPRVLETQVFDLSPGGSICFDLIFATQANASPCEGPDEPDEGVYLQYSTDGGATWQNIHYFDPNGGYDQTLTSWNNYCFNLPQGALFPNVSIRWFQDASTSDLYDHWGIDNVLITLNDIDYYYEWQHDLSSDAENPTPVSPLQNTSYEVIYTNGVDDTCSATVDVVVNAPLLNVNAGNDTTICPGTCLELPGEAALVSIPGGQQERCEIGDQTIDAGGFSGFTLDYPIYIGGMNASNISSGMIQSICIDLEFNDAWANPNDGLENIQLQLICPNGTAINLVNQGGVSGHQMQSTCFGPMGSNISGASAPYTDTYKPNEPLNLLNGCDVAGTWTIRVINQGLWSNAGVFQGVCITINDLDQEFPAMFSWSPNTNMVNANTLNPTVCPSTQTTYTINAEDSNSCASASDQITINVANSPACCPFTFSPQITSSGNCSTGATSDIDIQLSNGGNFSFVWSDGATTEDRTNLANGQYGVTVTDLTNNCSKDTLFILSAQNSGSTLQIDSITANNETCFGLDNGSAIAFATTSAPPITYNWGLASSQTTQGVANIAPGSYMVTLTDNNGCEDSSAFQILSGQQLSSSFVVNDVTCGGQNGFIGLTVNGGSGVYDFLWSDGSTTEDISQIQGGLYSVSITDQQTNCTIDTSTFVSSIDYASIDSIVVVDESCSGTNDGAATVFVSGGIQPYTYSFSTSPIGTQTNTLTNLPSGNYGVTLTDGMGCTIPDSFYIQPGVVIDIITQNIDGTTCDQSNGLINLFVNGGSQNFDYQWSNGETQLDLANIDSGLYVLTLTDLNFNCVIQSQYQVPYQVPPSISLDIENESCPSQFDGWAIANVNGGTMPFNYIWSSGINSNIDTAFSLSQGSYSVSVIDNNNCLVTQNFTITAPLYCCDLEPNFVFSDTLCSYSNNGFIQTQTTGGSLNYAYNWSTGAQSGSISNLNAGTYYLTLTDQLNPTCVLDTFVELVQALDFTSNIEVTHESCLNGQNGAVNIDVLGGDSPFSVVWDNTLTSTNGFEAEMILPGSYDVTIEDRHGCQEIKTFFINPGSGCCPVQFSATISGIDCFNKGSINAMVLGANGSGFTYSINSGDFSTNNTFTNLEVGHYTISAEDNNGCRGDTILYIPVLDTTFNVDFDFFPENPTTSNTLIEFENTSSDAFEYTWNFADLESSTEMHPTYFFPDSLPGTYPVCLWAKKGFCEDSLCKDVVIAGEEMFFIPNAFTPNDDDENDLFFPVLRDDINRAFTFKVFDRWGGLLYETDQGIPWNGREFNTGEMTAQGVYMWVIRFDKKFAGKRKYTGIVFLLPGD